KIAKIKSLGTSGDLTRAIEAPIEMCSDEWIAKEENRRWSDLASSADGKILAAVVDNGASDAYTGDDGFIYILTDGGDNWEAKLADVPRRWYDIDMSADGTFLIAVENGGNPWVSEDYGNSWTMRGNPGAAGTRNWYEVAYLNGDGRILLAEFNGVNGRIWSSDNKGVDWTRRTDTNRKWVDIAASSDGQKLVAITFNDLTATDSGGIFTSIDRGNTWQRRTTDSKKWDDVASSPNGTYLAAVIKDGGIYVSDDSGVNWNPTSAPDRGWEDIISIGEDGQTLMASVNGGSIYTSTDRGVTWEEESAGSRKWFDLVSSADGKQIVAIDEGGKIYIKKICN
ncbi:MAG TPA: hypothetical protein DIT25_02360, partial [Candidatus Moranbacteria bacterium]|nr:hypothetical protein [Candidatus Moranbacteria bacterium]